MFKWTISEISITESEVSAFPLMISATSHLSVTPYFPFFRGLCVDTLIEKQQSFINKSQNKAILSIRLCESRSQKKQPLNKRLIVVDFDEMPCRENLNEILGSRKLDQVPSNSSITIYRASTDFQVRKILSTLNEISPFSLAMKNAMLDFLLPTLKEEQRLNMLTKVFDKYEPTATPSDTLLSYFTTKSLEDTNRLEKLENESRTSSLHSFPS